MLSAVLFVPLALVTRSVLTKVWRYFFAAVVFVMIYSVLPHKELRFIFYAIPLLTLVAATQLDHVMGYVELVFNKVTPNSVKKHAYPYLISLVLFGSTFAVSLIFLLSSAKNYHGATALNHLHSAIVQNAPKVASVHVHLDVETAMNGVSRFLQNHHGQLNITYSKEERLDNADYSDFDYLVTAKNPKARNLAPYFQLIHVENGFSRFNFKRFKVETVPKLYILKRSNIQEDMEAFRPIMKWTQRADKILLTAEMYDVDPKSFSLQINSNSFIIRGSSASKQYYAFIPTFGELDSETSKYTVGSRWIKIELGKKEQGFWPRLTCFKNQFSFIKIDWDNWVEPKDAIVEPADKPSAKVYSNGK